MTRKVESAAIPEPDPQPSSHPDIADMVAQDTLLWTGNKAVAQDIMDRKAKGMEKYGTALRPLNGRNAAMDLYQELVDAANYLRQLIYERTRFEAQPGEVEELRKDYLTLLTMLGRYAREARSGR